MDAAADWRARSRLAPSRPCGPAPSSTVVASTGSMQGLALAARARSSGKRGHQPRQPEGSTATDSAGGSLHLEFRRRSLRHGIPSAYVLRRREERGLLSLACKPGRLRLAHAGRRSSLRPAAVEVSLRESARESCATTGTPRPCHLGCSARCHFPSGRKIALALPARRVAVFPLEPTATRHIGTNYPGDFPAIF